MKKFNKFFLILAMSFLLFSQVFAQAPQGIPYQGVARTGNGQLICNKKITLIFKSKFIFNNQKTNNQCRFI